MPLLMRTYPGPPFRPSKHLADVRERAWNAANLLNALLALGYPGIEAAHLAQESSYVGNPPTRHGRH
jgi:hypothetical protein